MVAEPLRGTERLLSLDAMQAEAEVLATAIEAGAVVWLSGEVGSGKTTFVQGFARAMGVDYVRSPTFSLVNEYRARDKTLIHVDCYRLRSPAEALDLDFPDLERRATVLIVEWPEQGGEFVPAPDVHIVLRHGDDPSVRLLERVR